jgi:hypothetical protein
LIFLNDDDVVEIKCLKITFRNETVLTMGTETVKVNIFKTPKCPLSVLKVTMFEKSVLIPIEYKLTKNGTTYHVKPNETRVSMTIRNVMGILPRVELSKFQDEFYVHQESLINTLHEHMNKDHL